MREKLTETKQHFIDKASLLLKHRLALATGAPRSELPLDPDRLDSSQTPRMLDELFIMLQQVQLTSTVEAESTKDVVSLIGRGKLSLDDGMKLIKIIKEAESPLNTAEGANKLTIEIAKGGAT